MVIDYLQENNVLFFNIELFSVYKNIDSVNCKLNIIIRY
jgi:hypothetical protein